MKLEPGMKAPDFTLPSTAGYDFGLQNELTKGRIILYFYPKDFTMGCTKEACGLRDEFSNLREAKLRVIGVSTDSIESHEKFIKEHRLPFELLSDVDGSVSRLFGAYNSLFKISSRVTFIIGEDGTILSVTRGMLPGPHLVTVKNFEEKSR